MAVVAGLLCVWVLVCGALAANEEWHHWFHGHADDGDETSCALCMFASGAVDQPHCDPSLLQRPVGEITDSPVPPALLLPAGFRHDSPGRGPPLRRA